MDDYELESIESATIVKARRIKVADDSFFARIVTDRFVLARVVTYPPFLCIASKTPSPQGHSPPHRPTSDLAPEPSADRIVSRPGNLVLVYLFALFLALRHYLSLLLLFYVRQDSRLPLWREARRAASSWSARCTP
ncbi:hypothetical protein K466DRAFT_584666 [Polyporus arcularius HHB13444]|uniref:Uncharacterized protein n=1 Tax=Polyporus arcularius HHB13444 TaxID=1314778 RepID=A0A5C3PM98_9APHY|nr:hypothetical protein K466DRAFT_584666 [Polyporus arcularius HHB13444]